MRLTLSIAAALLSLACLRLTIHGNSMAPTLPDGTQTWLCPVSEDSTIQRGDVVVFQFGYQVKRGELPLVKRVTGVPGDSLGARFGREVPGWVTWAVVPEGSYYVKGDNPTGYYDSRTFGLIGRAQILGVVPTP